MSVLNEIIAPKEDADDEILVGVIYCENGDNVSEGDELLELETSKNVMTVTSPCSGFIECLVETEAVVKAGEVIIRIHDQFDLATIKGDSASDEKFKCSPEEKKIISKKAKLYIEKHKIEISQIEKTFIRLVDVVEANSKLSPGEKESHSNRYFDRSKLTSTEMNLEVKKIRLKLAKQIEVAALSSVQSAGLVSTIFYNVDDCPLPISENLIINSTGSFLSIITYEVSKLLEKYQMLNAYYDKDSIMEYLDINIGIALDNGDGLKVYTIKNTNELSLKDVELEISQGIYSYLRKALTPNQIKGSTFTITDMSSLGVDRFVPLINHNQSAILGISAFDKKLNRFTLGLSFDHRVTEGKVASRFLSELSLNLIKHCQLGERKS